MTQALYRKWRPQTWDDVVGQQHVITTLRQAVAGGRVAHAYLFSGPRGTGKTTTARLLAKAVNCLAPEAAARPCNACAHCLAVNEAAFMDLIEIDAASNTSVEDVRELRERVPFAPAEGRQKVYIIDEVHMLSTAAFNALLKTLEEPPAHVLFILATTEAHKIPATVVSRCQRHEFRRLSVPEIVDQLEAIAKEEGWQAERDALEAVARQATGSLRDAVSLFDQLGSLGERVTLARTLEVLGAAGNEAVQELADCLAGRDAAGGLKVIHRATDAGTDARQFARQVVDYLRGVMLAASGNADLVEAAPESRERMRALAEKMDPVELLRAMRAFSQAASDTRSGWRPQLPLEIALLESTGAQPVALPASAPAAAPARPAASAPRGPSAAAPAASPKPSAAPRAPRADSAGSAPAGAGALSLGQAREALARALERMRERDTRTYTIFSGARVDGVEDDLIILGFGSDLIKEKASRPETITTLQGGLIEVLGRTVRIRCVAGKARAVEAQGKYTEGGMVDTAARELGAQVIDLP